MDDTAAAQAYRRGSVARCRALDPAAGPDLVDRDDLYGLLASPGRRRTRLVVVGDDAAATLAATMPAADDGIVAIAETADACVRHLRSLPGWRDSAATAMARPDLRTVPEVAWPGGLRLRPVRRTPDDDSNGVALADAVAILDAEGPGRPAARRGLQRHLAGLPSTRLLAAVDADGVVRATSAYGVFDDCAHVIFVNTHPAWRRRGVATAMTAAAVAGAAAGGATSAFLDASAEGQGPYARLGFVAVMTTARFARYPT